MDKLDTRKESAPAFVKFDAKVYAAFAQSPTRTKLIQTFGLDSKLDWKFNLIELVDSN